MLILLNIKFLAFIQKLKLHIIKHPQFSLIKPIYYLANLQRLNVYLFKITVYTGELPVHVFLFTDFYPFFKLLFSPFLLQDNNRTYLLLHTSENSYKSNSYVGSSLAFGIRQMGLCSCNTVCFVFKKSIHVLVFCLYR